MLKYIFTLVVTAFLLGFTLHALLGQVADAYPSLSTSLSSSEAGGVEGVSRLINPEERASPYPRISKDKIHVFNDRVVIELENPQWSTFTDTNSMDPVFDAGHYAIQEVPQSEQNIHVGDIISYQYPGVTQGNLIHRVMQVGTDEHGWFAIVKGDNNPLPDPGKVRFSQVKKVVTAIIY